MSLTDFDHPLVFVFFLMLALVAMQGIVTWGAKRAGFNGLAALIQHP